MFPRSLCASTDEQKQTVRTTTAIVNIWDLMCTFLRPRWPNRETRGDREDSCYADSADDTLSRRPKHSYFLTLRGQLSLLKFSEWLQSTQSGRNGTMIEVH